MTKLDALAALGALPADAQVTFTVSAGELRTALEQRAHGGPENLTTKQASAAFGYSPDWWRKAAERGQVAGAWQDAPGRGPWRLPRVACEDLIRQKAGAPDASPPSQQPTSRRPRRGTIRGPQHRPTKGAAHRRRGRPALTVHPGGASAPAQAE